MSATDFNTAALHDPFRLRLGFMNSAGKFLTAEPFGFKLNVSGSSLKKRQTWSLVSIDGNSSTLGQILIRSHLNRYLASDKDGRVTCTADESERDSEECRFVIEFSLTNAGGWAFRSVAYGYYLTGNDDLINCFSKTPVYWRPHLAIHPQVHIKNLFSQRYLRLEANEIRGDQTLPWGHTSLITLEHRAGLIAVRTSDNRYLLADGSLAGNGMATSLPSTNNGGFGSIIDRCGLFHLEIRTVGQSTGLALKDQLGCYLSLIGNTATVKSKNKSVTRDDLFVLEDSYVQVALLAHNGKYASIRQGVDLYANQSEIEETEIFQLEFQPHNKLWRIRSSNGKLWSVDSGTGGIKSTGNEKDPKTFFCLDYESGEAVGGVGLRAASNRQYVTSRKLGVVAALGSACAAPLPDSPASSERGDCAASTAEVTLKQEERWHLVLMNRPMLVLRCEYGAIGARHGRVECNLTSHQTFRLEHIGEGAYTLSSEDGGSCWAASGDGYSLQLVSKSQHPEVSTLNCFFLRFLNRTQLVIRAAVNNKYLRGEQSGVIKADSADYGQICTLWEY